MNFLHNKWNTKQLLVTYLLLLSFIRKNVQTMFENRNEKQTLQTQKLTHTWAMEVLGGEQNAKLVSKSLGFKYLGSMGSLRNYYVVQREEPTSSRTRRNIELKAKRLMSLNQHFQIFSMEQMKVLIRKKRDYIEDPFFKDQWYLNNTGQTRNRCSKHKDGSDKLDLNVTPVWKKNITGQGVIVSILDDGIEYTHPDLKRNYHAAASFDYNSYDKFPFPRYDGKKTNKHGTRCAGEIAGERGNGVCGIGVAYNAKVAGIRMLDGEVSDAIEGASLSHAREMVDIYSISWGPEDDGRTVDGPAKFANKAFEDGVKLGRDKLGSIFVWATGNGGGYGDFCSCDGYINSIYTVAIGAIDNCGRKPWYSEPCPGTIAVTYSSGEKSGKFDRQIVTTDLRKECTSDHTGTSGAAPLAAGIFALVLEANPKLSWRDLQNLIVKTSQKVDPNDSGWHTNGAGYHFNIMYGFGTLDALKLVEAAQSPNWRTAKPGHTLNSSLKIVDLHSIGYNQRDVHSTITFKGCRHLEVCIDRLEHVHVVISVTLNPHRHHNGHRGHLSIDLTSPFGTKSEILRQRHRDVYKVDKGFKEWEFLTLFHWGENPKGDWKLTVTDHSGEKWYLKKELKWKLKFYGTFNG